jgi:hypothetical protein
MTRNSGFSTIVLLHGVVSHKRFPSSLSFLAGLRQPPPPHRNDISSTHFSYSQASHLSAHNMSYWWLRPLQATAKGAGITLGSTVISCGLAIQVEKTANRLFFFAAPHWYANVDYAYGITDEQLASVRHLRGGSTGSASMACVWNNGSSSLTTQQPVPSECSSVAYNASSSSSTDFSSNTKFSVPRDRNDTSAPITVVVIPIGDIMSNALTG